jgi:hypothetical protein
VRQKADRIAGVTSRNLSSTGHAVGYVPQLCIRQATYQPCYYNLRSENMDNQVDV